MHTAKVLHTLLSQSASSIHTTRLNTFITAVQALTQGANATITSLGRHLSSEAYDKHKIKRMDRLIANNHLCNESLSIYTSVTQRILKGIRRQLTWPVRDN